MEGLERRWGGARGRRGRDRRPRFWWTVVVRRGCGVRSRAGSCVIGFPAVNIRCKPGMSSSEHVDRGRDLGGVPIPYGLVKRERTVEHALHCRVIVLDEFCVTTRSLEKEMEHAYRHGIGTGEGQTFDILLLVEGPAGDALGEVKKGARH